MDNRHPTGDDKENKSVRRAMLEKQAAEEQKRRLEEGDFDEDASPAGKAAAKRAAAELDENEEGTRRNRDDKSRGKIASKPLVKPTDKTKKK